jgi:DNA-binding MarR family transcriptional regulator
MTTRSVARLYDRALAEVGLRQVAYTILARLEAEGPISMNGVSARLALDRTTCSREVAPLVRAGLVHVDVGEDRRRRLLRLSDAGAERLARARPHWRRVQQQVEDSFGGQTGDLLDALRALLDATEQLATQGHPPRKGGRS